MASPNPQPAVVVHGAPIAMPTLLGQGVARLPTDGKIRAGIKVLTRRAAEVPQAQTIYDQGLAQGQSFDQIERVLTEALPRLKTPLVPRNVPWFTVRAQDFANPELAEQILALYGEDRGEGRHLYRFPVVFPTDRYQNDPQGYADKVSTELQQLALMNEGVDDPGNRWIESAGPRFDDLPAGASAIFACVPSVNKAVVAASAGAAAAG